MLTYPQTMLVAQADYARTIGLEVIRRSDIFAKLPMARMDGASKVYEREGTEPSVDWIADGGAAPESGTAFRKVYTELATMANTVTESGPQRRYKWDPAHLQRYTSKVIKAQVYDYMDKIWNGSRAVGTLAAATITGIAVASVGPNVRLGTGLIQLTVAGGPVKTLAWQAPGDTGVGASSADLNAVPAGTAVTLTSADGTAELRLTVEGAALNVGSVEVSIAITTATNEFDGIRRLLPSTQLCDPTGVDGSVLSLDFLRQARDLNEGTTQSMAWFSTRAGLRQFRKLLDASNITPEQIQLGTLGTRPAFEGIPWLVSDNLPDNLTKGAGTALTEIWLVSFGPADGSPEVMPMQADGVVGLYGGNAADEESVMQALPGDESSPQRWMGFWLDDSLGKVHGYDQFERQVGADVGVALYSQKALSCLRYIRTT